MVVASTALASPGPSAAQPAPASGWTTLASGTTRDLRGVSFPDQGHGWAVGAGGTIVATADGGRSWAPQAACAKSFPCTPTSPDMVSADLTAVSFPDPAHGWAVGTGGTIVATADGGRSWSPEAACAKTVACTATSADRVSADLTGVSFADPAHGWAVGAGGTIVATGDGGRSWSRQLACEPQASNAACTDALALDVDLNAVSFTDTANGWAVGRSGLILFTTDGGTRWTATGFVVAGHGGEPGPDLRAASTVQPGVGHVVGAGGTVLIAGKRLVAFADGTARATQSTVNSFEAQDSGTPQGLNGVSFNDYFDGHAVGDGGTTLSTTDGGTTWVPAPSTTTANLRAVSFPDANHGWAVGDGGTIVGQRSVPGGLSVTGVSPGRGPTEGRVAVTVSGTGFNGATAVNFGTASAEGFVVDSETQITAVAPQHLAVTVDVTVTARGQTSEVGPAGRFAYLAPTGVSWTAVAPCARPCNGPAVRLGGGKVLVAGGCQTVGVTGDCGESTVSAEVYDPSGGAWAATGPLHQARSHHSMVVLGDGRVLAVGGSGLGAEAPGSAEVYDPATGTWHDTGPLRHQANRPTATLLRSGKVLVTGEGDHPQDQVGAELYDPSTGAWQPTAPLAHSRSQTTATLLRSGQVLVTGPNFGDDSQVSAELYDPATSSWRDTTPLSVARSDYTTTLLSDGRVLVVGGDTPSPRGLAAVPYAEIYDPATATWSPTGPLLVPRYLHAAARLPSGKVLVSGGYGRGAQGALVGAAEIFDPRAGTWEVVSPMDTPRARHSATLLGDGKVLVAGGVDFTYLGNTASSQRLDVGSGNVVDAPLGSAELFSGSPSVVGSSSPRATSAHWLARVVLGVLVIGVVMAAAAVLCRRRDRSDRGPGANPPSSEEPRTP